MKIKWINKYSNESGFVKSVSYKNNHFINTFDENEAKNYATTNAAQKEITKLINCGEGNNNEFIVVD